MAPSQPNAVNALAMLVLQRAQPAAALGLIDQAIAVKQRMAIYRRISPVRWAGRSGC